MQGSISEVAICRAKKYRCQRGRRSGCESARIRDQEANSCNDGAIADERCEESNFREPRKTSARISFCGATHFLSQSGVVNRPSGARVFIRKCYFSADGGRVYRAGDVRETLRPEGAGPRDPAGNAPSFAAVVAGESARTNSRIHRGAARSLAFCERRRASGPRTQGSGRETHRPQNDQKADPRLATG